MWNFVGSTAGVLVLYVYPAAFYLRLRYVRYKARARNSRTSIRAQYNIYAIVKEGVAWVILAIGLVLLVVENYQAITAIVDSSDVNDQCKSWNISSNAGSCYTLTCNSTGITNSSSEALGFSVFSDYT